MGPHVGEEIVAGRAEGPGAFDRAEIPEPRGLRGGIMAFREALGGAVVLTNVARDVGEIAFAALLPEAMATSPTKETTLSPKTLAEYAGRYRLAPSFDLVVGISGTELTVQATGQSALPVFTSARDEFFYKVVDAQLSFQRAADGSVSSVVLHQNGRDLKGARQSE